MLFKLLGLPFSLPMKGLGFVFDKVAEMADSELYDDAVWREQLMLLQMQLEEGEIEEDEYAEREAEILQRLREIKAHREAQLQAMLAAQREAEVHDSSTRERRRVIVETPFDDQS